MSNNIFNGKRFMLLCRQHFIHNNELLLLGTVAYVGLVFIILSLTQIGNDLQPHDVEIFRGFLLGFVGVFGMLYVGYSFPAFRSKENTINYLMVPGSLIEKFLFEFISRIGIMLVLLPLLFWVSFHLEGYFLAMFSDQVFEPIGLNFFTHLKVSEVDDFGWLFTMISAGVLFAFVLAFTGAAMFGKQPLIKSLFSVAVVMICYTLFAYLVIEHLGVGNYQPPASMWLVPNNDVAAFKFIGMSLIMGNIIMLFVAFRKLKEREV
jgi:hypothetical protein